MLEMQFRGVEVFVWDLQAFMNISVMHMQCEKKWMILPCY